MNSVFDVIVIGAGAHGSAAAYHAAKRGQRVLLIEQFAVDHDCGSSYGHSRIIRYAYNHPTYVALARAAYSLWASLEAEAGEQLLLTSGGVDIGRMSTASFASTVDSLTQMQIPFELLDAKQAMQRYPQFRLAEDMLMLVQADAGILRASRCVQAQVKLAQANGAQVLEKTTVMSIAPDGDGVRVVTKANVFSAGRAIIAAGAWANDLLTPLGLPLPLRPTLCQENYFHAERPADYAIGAFPVFIWHERETFGWMSYGIPSVNDAGVKFSLHGGPDFDPHDSQREPLAACIEAMFQLIATYFPTMNPTHASSRACLYTMTPDEHFIIDKHPAYPQIVIGAACSGHGFKFASVIGSILCDLAFEGCTAHDIDLFKIARFERGDDHAPSS
ncbi:MAG: N-methyl-L-tryptophan oxidase [Aggregatilineales bacterium]